MTTKSFYDKLNQEYFSGNSAKIPSSRTQQIHQPSNSPDKRNIIMPTSTKNNNEYYSRDRLRTKGGALPGFIRKKGLRNTSLNVRTEISKERYPNICNSSGEITLKTSSISDAKPNSSNQNPSPDNNEVRR